MADRLKIPVLLLSAALILTAVSGLVAISIEKTYLENHSYFYDPVSYSVYNVGLWDRLADEGRFSLAVREWLGNSRHPLRTVPLIVFAPQLLAEPFGHTATVLPMLAAFLFVFGWTVYSRTKYLPYALASMALFSAIPGMFNPIRGLASNWLDLAASFLVGAAVMSLAEAINAKNFRWLIAFSVFAAGAALSRYTAAMFVFIAAAPIFVYYLFRRVQAGRGRVRAILPPLLIVFGLVGVLAGYFLIAHLRENMLFYSIYGYSLGQPVPTIAVSTVLSLAAFLGIQGAVILGLIGSANLVLFWKSQDRDRASLAVSAWPAIAIFLYILLGLRAVHTMVALYLLPFVALLVVAPFAVGGHRQSKWSIVHATVVLLIAGIVLGVTGGAVNYRLASRPSPQAARQKDFDIALARGLAAQGDRLVWNAYFDEYAWIPTMETFYRFGKLHRPAGQPFFNAHLSAWRGDYPEMSPAEVNKLVYDATAKWVDIAVVFSDPGQAKKGAHLDNSYSRAVAAYIAKRISGDPKKWRRVFTLESPVYGKLIGYRNRTSSGERYELAVKGGWRPR